MLHAGEAVGCDGTDVGLNLGKTWVQILTLSLLAV